MAHCSTSMRCLAVMVRTSISTPFHSGIWTISRLMSSALKTSARSLSLALWICSLFISNCSSGEGHPSPRSVYELDREAHRDSFEVGRSLEVDGVVDVRVDACREARRGQNRPAPRPRKSVVLIIEELDDHDALVPKRLDEVELVA